MRIKDIQGVNHFTILKKPAAKRLSIFIRKAMVISTPGSFIGRFTSGQAAIVSEMSQEQSYIPLDSSERFQITPGHLNVCSRLGSRILQRKRSALFSRLPDYTSVDHVRGPNCQRAFCKCWHRYSKYVVWEFRLTGTLSDHGWTRPLLRRRTDLRQIDSWC